MSSHLVETFSSYIRTSSSHSSPWRTHLNVAASSPSSWPEVPLTSTIYFFLYFLGAVDFYYFFLLFLLCAIDFYYFFLLFLLGAVGFYSGNLKTLTADMKALKPTILPAVPRFQDPLSFHFCQCPHIFCHPCCEKSTQLSPGFSTGCMTAASTRQTKAVFSGKRKINKKDKSPNLEGTSSILPSRQRPESSTRDLSGGIQFGTNLSSGRYLFLQNISC